MPRSQKAAVDKQDFSWIKVACFSIFLPMVVNLIVLATYLLGSS